MHKSKKPFLLNISGPYGVGKDSILNKVLSSYPTETYRVSTITTRAVSREMDPSYKHIDFDTLDVTTSEGRWIVNYQISGKVAYGTSIDEIEEKAHLGLICVHSIYAGPDGAGRLREVFGKNLFSIGLCATHGDVSKQIEVTRERLINRGRDSIEIIEARLKHQIQPIQYVIDNPIVKTPNGDLHVFDEIVTNEDLGRSMQHVLRLFQKIFITESK